MKKENNMKKLIALLLVAVMAIGLAACGGSSQPAATSEASGEIVINFPRSGSAPTPRLPT